MSKQLPGHAQVVIIGGGIAGCGVAYHLAKYGWTDVVLLERKALTCGTTWAAAGLCAQMRATKALTKLAVYGTELYAKLEEETGQSTGYKTLGSILCSQTPARTAEYDRLAAMGRSFGIEMGRISPSEAKDKFPLMVTDDLDAIFWCPNDGVTLPVDTARAMAKGAVMRGAKIFDGVEATEINLNNGTIESVSTNQGDIKCEYVVNCAGMWGMLLGEKIGVAQPLYATEHMHIITKPIDGITDTFPTMRDMDGCIYIREEVGGLMLGGFEPAAKPWGEGGEKIPKDFEFSELSEDWEQFNDFLEAGIKRVPILEDAEIIHLTNVPESFTPDGIYMLGKAPGVNNYFMANGMNSLGIASSAGAGKALAEWMIDGAPSEDLWEVDCRRVFHWQLNRSYLRERVKEVVGLLYDDHWPFRQVETARPVRCTPFHDRLANMGACFGQAFGWERANWFAPDGVEPKYEYSWGRQNWFEYSAQEHMAVREGVGVYDLTSMAQFLMQGRDSKAVMQRICANDVDVPVGQVVYTQLLNERGGIEADVTVTPIKEDTYFIVTAGATAVRDFDWIRRLIPKDAHAFLTDVSSGYAMLGVMGPKSRDLLSKLTNADLSNEAFPYRTAQEIDVAYARPLAVRMSYVGELGWELYIPTEFATGVFDALVEAGKEFDLKQVGLHALDSLRLEKGFKHWGSDIGPDDTPYEAGLGFAVKMDNGDFIGRDALLKQKDEGTKRKLVMFTLDDPEPLLYHDEPILRNGELVSCNTHGAYAHLLNCSMGMGYIEMPEGINNEWIISGNYEIDVEGTLFKTKAHLKPPYDPAGERMKI